MEQKEVLQMTKHKIKSATACYTGGGLYIFYGQLESGLYFSAYDEWESIYICDTETSAEEAQYPEWQEQHTVEELTGENFKCFWNAMLLHIINGGLSYDEQDNYLKGDLEERIIRRSEQTKRIIEATYAPNSDITFIMEYIETDEGEPVQTSVVGWYYGEPDEENTAYYVGKLTATY